MKLLLSILLSANLFPAEDTVHILPAYEVTATMKQSENWRSQPLSGTSFTVSMIGNNRIQSPKDLSLITPNFYIPDYGSKMTSSMYVRGLGARMDQPAMGLYIDNIPILNKNSYDFDFYDIRRIDILRGPQGTLYGRNTIGGVINIQTFTPGENEGTGISLDYGSANSFSAGIRDSRRLSDKFYISTGLYHQQSEGFYTNRYTGKKCDRIMSSNARLRFKWEMPGQWSMDNSFSINRIDQDGFAYSRLDEITGEIAPIEHNDPCTYERIGLYNGTTLQYIHPNFHFSATTSYQFLDDKMNLDQDFTPESLFTLLQAQKEHAVTQEVIIKSNGTKRWKWLTGAFGFYKHIKMNAPVTFKKDGIDQLILANANRWLPAIFPGTALQIREEEFIIGSRFELPAFGVSLYHQSEYQLNRFLVTAGLRFDYEQNRIDYKNGADIHYRYTHNMAEFRLLETTMTGKDKMHFGEVMPKLSLQYMLSSGTVYATVTRGYKTGGFNTQIFSDILQNKLMENLIKSLSQGIHIESDDHYDVNKAIAYKPEYSWNYELGGHVSLWNNRLLLDLALFYIDGRNQQITVFPPGKNTGRYMSNAGHTRSYGIEFTPVFRTGGLRLDGSYGYTHASFVSYHDGHTDYKDKIVPYAPQHTVYLGGNYTFDWKRKWIDRLHIRIGWQGVGRIYWNESNELYQNFYGQLEGMVKWERKNISVSLWGKNLTDKDFNTFYFKSVGNSFVQKGKPVRGGISLDFRF